MFHDNKVPLRDFVSEGHGGRELSRCSAFPRTTFFKGGKLQWAWAERFPRRRSYLVREEGCVPCKHTECGWGRRSIPPLVFGVL